jgi:hypothetical protein
MTPAPSWAPLLFKRLQSWDPGYLPQQSQTVREDYSFGLRATIHEASRRGFFDPNCAAHRWAIVAAGQRSRVVLTSRAEVKFAKDFEALRGRYEARPDLK